MLGYHHLKEEELRLLARLRARRHQAPPQSPPQQPQGLGARVSDSVTSIIGSWPFIIVQSILLVIWMVLNTIAWLQHWDPYPFILLNLALSFQAAYTAPIIMMSQNRQAERDRNAVQSDYDVNLKAELEIELLHQKIDQLRETEVTRLTEMLDKLQSALLDVRAQPAAAQPQVNPGAAP